MYGMFENLGRDLAIAGFFLFLLGGLAFFGLSHLFHYFGHHRAIQWK